MRCPSCQVTDEEETPGAGWFARFPKQVLADFSRFIDCASLFSLPGVYRCYNCGTYLHEGASATERLELKKLEEILQPSLCHGFVAVLSFPPDLLRVVTNELRLGNETACLYRTDTELEVLVLRERFHDGHIVSSWIEYQALPSNERWQAWYLCPTTQNAIACEHLPQ